MNTFGEWLQQQRTHRRLTREEFANRVGCSVAMLRKIETGERRPSTQIAELMANAFEIPPAEHATFVRVARGELSVDRLHPESKPIATATISSRKTNLPLFPTPLIGREREVEQLSQLLRDPQCRLLALVGPGGIGKTRLAIETAAQVQDVFANGVYFIPLASVNTTRFIVPVIADAIGFTFQSANRADPKTQLFGYLKEKQVLLLPDNLEQLLTEPGIELLPELLGHAPQVKLLATSRESLGLQEEWVFEVEGLPVPESIYAEGSAQNTSVELFLQRARRAHVGFNATPEDYPAILRICQLVDGMPLAIELAAAWVRALSCDEIAREIEHGMDFLSISARDIPARHRSMRAVFDHSWKLLTEESSES
jgi:predicted ATPase